LLKCGKLEESMKTKKQILKELKTIDITGLNVSVLGVERAIYLAVSNKLNTPYHTTSNCVLKRVAKFLFENKKYIIL